MSSKYYNSSGKEVFNGDIVQDSDLNSINSAVDAGFQVVEADIALVNAESLYYSNLADTARIGAEAARAGAEAARDVCLSVQPIVVAEGDTQVARVISIADSLVSLVPVGTIMPFLGGYFTNNSNGGFTNVIGNTAAAINSRINSDGYYVCNGAALNSSISAIFNGAGRYLPNLTDSRFLMGSSSGGTIGGDNTMSHTHTLSHTHSLVHTHTISHTHTIAHTHTTGSHVLTIAEMPSHRHRVTTNTLFLRSNDVGISVGGGYADSYSDYVGGGGSHNHGNTGAASATYAGAVTTASSGAASVSTSSNASTQTTSIASYLENRPKFLSCFYIMKAI